MTKVIFYYIYDPDFFLDDQSIMVDFSFGQLVNGSVGRCLYFVLPDFCDMVSFC